MDKDLPSGVFFIFLGTLFVGLPLILKNVETVSGQPEPWNPVLLGFLAIGIAMALGGAYDIYKGGDKLRAIKKKKETQDSIEATLKHSTEILKIPEALKNHHLSAFARSFIAPRIAHVSSVELRPNGCLELHRNGQIDGIIGFCVSLIFCIGTFVLYLKTKEFFWVPMGLISLYIFSVSIRLIHRKDKIQIGEHEIVFLRQGQFGSQQTRLPRSQLSGIKITRRRSSGKNSKVYFAVTINLQKSNEGEDEIWIYSSSKIEAAEKVTIRLCEHLSLPQIANVI